MTTAVPASGPRAFRRAALRRGVATLGGLLATLPGRALANSLRTAPPPSIASLLPDARLAGEGELRWLGLRIYSARLWVGPAGIVLDTPAARPMALELSYHTALRGETIVESSVREIARLGVGDAAQRGQWEAAMMRLFPDVARGDRLTGVVDSGRGTRFLHNDRPIGSIADPAFTRAFFSIWLDERTQAPSLRESVMRRASTLADSRP